jgi:hypothetical protein
MSTQVRRRILPAASCPVERVADRLFEGEEAVLHVIGWVGRGVLAAGLKTRRCQAVTRSGPPTRSGKRTAGRSHNPRRLAVTVARDPRGSGPHTHASYARAAITRPSEQPRVGRTDVSPVTTMELRAAQAGPRARACDSTGRSSTALDRDRTEERVATNGTASPTRRQAATGERHRLPGPEVAEHGEHATVIVARLLEAHLREDVSDVLLHGLRAQEEPSSYRGVRPPLRH